MALRKPEMLQASIAETTDIIKSKIPMRNALPITGCFLSLYEPYAKKVPRQTPMLRKTS